jgi:hypothetical protein
VNENHAKLLGSPEWATVIQEYILPVIAQGVDLGQGLLFRARKPA